MATGTTRVLLVTASDDEANHLTAALGAEGAETTRVGAVCDATDLIQKHGFDAVVLSHPLPDADVIGSCATLAQLPAAPPMILLDVIDATAAIESTVPSEMRPKRILKKPIDAPKLGFVLREILEEPSDEMSLSEPGFDQLTHLLVDLNQRGRTGTLEVRADGVVTRVHFRHGLAIGAEGGSLRETLGRMLLRRGTLSEEDYVRVIERMTSQVFDNEHIRMGEALVELGLLSGEEVHRALSEQVAEKITACFQWRAAQFDFEEMDEPPAGVGGFDIPPIEALVLRALQLHVPSEEIEARLGPDRKKRIRLSRPVQEVLALFQIETSWSRVLGLLDGSRKLETLLEGGDHARLLAALLWTGSASFAEDPSAAPAAGRATPERRGRPQFAREVVMPRKRARARAAQSQGERDTAPTAETRVDDSKTKLEAEQLYRRAQGYLSAEKFTEAIRTMARVVALQPNEPEYRMVEAWAAYLQSRVVVRVARAKAVATARRVTEADPQAARPHAILGNLALDAGDDALASREFQAALIRDPEDEDALRGMKRAGGQKP